MRVDEVFETIVSASGRRAVCLRLGDADERSFEANLLNFVLSTSLTLRGEEPLHATVVDLGGRVAGLLGPSGVAGTIVNLSLGDGVQTGEVSDSTTYYANVVPSVRNEVQTLGQGLSLALASTAPLPAAAVRSAAARTVKTAASAQTSAPAKKAAARVSRHAASAKAASTR
jgi:hypothetical protein